jgi:hypothetical protein
LDRPSSFVSRLTLSGAIFLFMSLLLSTGRFIRFAGPIFLALLGNMLAYAALNVTATLCGTTSLAGMS